MHIYKKYKISKLLEAYEPHKLCISNVFENLFTLKK